MESARTVKGSLSEQMEGAMAETTKLRVRVSGRVQGVAYRAWARDEAERLGISGWVKNERDGSVTALLAGPAEAVARMVAAMRVGPRAAVVDRLETDPAAEAPPAGFEIRH
jgi:acylphosphatase